jgi:hypothetical protein
MWPQSWITKKDDVARALSAWDGAMAEPWEYSVSHKQFLLRLHHLGNSAAGSLFVFCKACDDVAFKSSWHGARVVLGEKKGQLRPEFQLTDGERLNVRAGAIFAASSPDYHVSLRDQ